MERFAKPVKYLGWSVLRKKVVTALSSSSISGFFEDLKTIIAYSLAQKINLHID